ncbi:type 1 glutamine amidotransferase domain-containing protein [Isoptericola aurantiacus]|uniref:type 1 glutamine amidotransferase domain-containing protein n=1 Tax=Isoptericola aurantiacus TaxID=3377839 RepID=UPI00383A696F
MPDTDLTGRTVLAIVTSYGVEQDELVVPAEHLRERGAVVTVASPGAEEVTTLVGDKDPGRTVPADVDLADVDPADFDLLLVPGGTLNADSLRLEEATGRIVRSFTGSGRPVAAICHGPWALVEAGVVAGKTLTTYPSLRTDVRNAGAAHWRDEPVVVDDAEGWTLITSRTPDDLEDFLGAIDTALGAG